MKDKGTYGVEKGDTEALNNTVQSHELKHTEGGDESRSALPVEKQHVWDEKQDVLWKEHLSLGNAVYNVEGPNKHPHQLQMIYFQNIQFETHLHHLRLIQHPKQFPQKPITHSKTHSLALFIAL